MKRHGHGKWLALLAVVVLLAGLAAPALAEQSPKELAAHSDVLYALIALDAEYPDHPVDKISLLNKAIEGENQKLRDNKSSLVIASIPAETDINSAAEYFLIQEIAASDELQKLGVQNPFQALEFAATDYMLASMHDSHVYFLSPEALQESQNELNNQSSFTGVGIFSSCFMTAQGAFVYPSEVFDNGPASIAGMQKFDEILSIGDQAISGRPSCAEAQDVTVHGFHGPQGTQVKTVVKRHSLPNPITLTITREPITVPQIETKKIANGISYIKVNAFSQGVSNRFKVALAKAAQSEKPKIVIDLRGNPGGLANEVFAMLSAIYGDGVPIIQWYDHNSTERQTTFSKGDAVLPANVPIVVLIDGGSASGSEIFASSIGESGRGKTVGETTAGALEAAIDIPLPNGAGMSLTVRKLFTGIKGKKVEGVGVTPDKTVKLDPNAIEQGRDNQLEFVVNNLNQILGAP